MFAPRRIESQPSEEEPSYESIITPDAAPLENNDDPFKDDLLDDNMFDDNGLDDYRLDDYRLDDYRLDDDATDAERREALSAQEECQIELAKLKANRISSIGLDIDVEGRPGQDVPYECTLGDETFAERSWAETTYMWKASSLCHKPLYFEDEHLERYGHSWGPYVQPLASGAHFFATLPILPYKVGLRLPNECVYALGHYRPGNCAPYMRNPIPFTRRAALMEVGAVLGTAAVLP